MKIGFFLFHGFPYTVQFLISSLSAPFFFQHKEICIWYFRAVRPDLPDQVFFCEKRSSIFFCCLCKCQGTGCTHDSSVKSQLLAFFQVFLYIFFYGRHARLSHTEQADPRPLKLCLCLQEIPSVSPQPRIILCNHCRTGRSGKTGDKGSCPEMLTDILRLMAVCGRHHIHCHAGCFHFFP